MEKGFVECCHSLERINLSSDYISSISCISLANIIKYNNCLININMSSILLLLF